MKNEPYLHNSDRSIPFTISTFSKENAAVKSQHELLHKENPPSNQKIRDSLFLKQGSAFLRVKLHDIAYLEADNNYTTIYAKPGKFVYAKVLKQVLKKLPPDTFVRINRKYVVNLHFVEGYEGNMLIIQQQRILVSKQYRDQVFPMFQVL